MMIGQISHSFPDAVVRERLGGFNDIPPNLTPATSQAFYRLLSLGYWRHERRQLRFDKRTCDCHLFIRPDLSGVMLRLIHQHARNSDEPVWGSYDCMPYTFTVCYHRTITSATKNAYSTYVRSTCVECGFWTEVDSSD